MGQPLETVLCPDNYIAQEKKSVVSAPNRKPWINQQELLTTDSLWVVNKQNPSDGSWYGISDNM